MSEGKMKNLKKLASKVICVTNGDEYELLQPVKSDAGNNQAGDKKEILDTMKSPKSISSGYFAVYVGKERLRFMVKTKYLTHPLFKMLLEKASNEFGHDHKDVLAVPCSVSAFQEVLNAVECAQGGFHFGESVDEFL